MAGDPHTRKIDYRPQTCFLMTQLGGTVPPEVDAMRRALGSVLDTHGFKLIDANSTITGRDFLTKQTDSLTLRSMAVDGLTGQAEGRWCPPAHAYAVCVSVVGRRGRVFVSS